MRRDVRSELRGVLPDDKLRLVPRSYDVIGSRRKAVAIIELREELEGFEHRIAAALMRVHRNVASVLARESERTGDFRVRELRLVAGDPDTEVLHRESGCVFRLDPRRVYFSSREGPERGRIAAKVREGESVLVMFSGVGPFPIRIARARGGVRVTAVELNPHAHNYCVENVHLNRVADRVRPTLGDVREVCPRMDEPFDRILMPLPRRAHTFLDVAVPLIGDGGVLHFYHWAPEPDLFSRAEELVIGAGESLGKRAEIIERARVSQYSPRVWKIRVDATFSDA
ncbi:hypothetical protein AC482_07150 [miscellaneous Crenarchaeota group-15 archaeon DG-45]|uniref:SAM-dependent methyltransferase TRM5/TYW2-type domain-containing protein n=1 Tax=miscellaneous Crenarchaeota group-15 archaeon DG-45 TaxID=1685127 RepID=A0A0M0BKW1_9ARCH|nr:MAG: hypothetical protein AC482_07150 [miscellaneous Crenarchaeota group-15 archaeon DG-45]